MELNVKSRDGKGKKVLSSLRTGGFTPGIVYGKGEPLNLAIDSKELMRFIESEKGQNIIFKVNIDEGKAEKQVVIKEMQVHPLRRNIIHIDLMEISMDKKIHIEVNVRLTGTAIGIKMGGLLNAPTRSVAIECLPGNLPKEFLVDITKLQVGDVIHVKDIVPKSGVRILDDPMEVVAAILSPQDDKKDESSEEAEESTA